jgi:cellobiose phosphorylase
VRENGGQYTHAAIWAAWAFAELGQGDRAAELFQMLNPISHADTPEKAVRYKVEPYIIAADIYSVSNRTQAWVAGPGTPAPPAGCIAWASKPSWASPE